MDDQTKLLLLSLQENIVESMGYLTDAFKYGIDHVVGTESKTSIQLLSQSLSTLSVTIDKFNDSNLIL